jgi:hypothetical protein
MVAFGSFRYIPDTAWDQFWAKHEEICAAWESELARVTGNYDQYVEEVREDFAAQAVDAWLALIGRANGATAEYVQQTSLDEFREMVVSRALDQLPTPDDIRERCTITLRPATFLLDSEMEQNLLEAAQARSERQRIEEKDNTWLRMERAHARKAEAEADAARQAAWEQRRREQAKTELERARVEEEIQRERQKTEARRQVQLELARAAITELATPYQEMVDNLRGLMLETAEELLININRHGRVLGKTAEKIGNMQATFRMLNTVRDPELEQAIEDLGAAMEQPGIEYRRDTEAVAQALQQVATVAMREATDAIDDLEIGAFDYLDL